MVNYTYDLFGTATPPDSVAYNKAAGQTVSINASSLTQFPTGTSLTFYPISDIAPAAASAPATFKASVVVQDAFTAPFTAPIIFYGPVSTNPAAAYTPILTTSITVTARDALAGTSTSTSTSSSSSQTNVTSTPPSSPASSGTQTSSSIASVSSGKTNNAGALAGAAVGCAIGGILLGFLIGFFLLKRRGRQSRAQRLSGSDKELSPLRGHGEAIVLGSGPKAAWMSHLPQSDSDSSVRAAASRILDQIEMHIENFYLDKNVTHMNVETQSAIEDFDSPHLPESILKLLPRTDKSTLLLKHCLTNYILSHTDPRNAGSSSFLPKDLTSLRMSPTRMTEPGFAQALSQWRVLTRFLGQDPEHDQTYLADRDRTIFAAAQNFCRAFEPWARSEESTRLQSLTGIMKRASDLGVLLFSQPAMFHWQWDRTGNAARQGVSTGTNTTQIVVLPGLYKTTDQEVVPLASPLHLLEPQDASVSGH